MLYEVDWAEDGTYRPDEDNSPEKFFNDGLANSTEFDLKLGYFSSATISVLADGFATFISNGGRMRLVINEIVSDNDKYAISKGMKPSYGQIINCFDLSNFEELKTTFDEYQTQFFECLAFLIYDKRIDIRIIRPKNKNGIAHTKSGQFRDGDSTTSFTGSANFTISGLFNNIEEIKIDRSDSIDPMVQKRIKNQKQDFDSIMNHSKKNIEYLSPDNLITAIQSNFGDKDIEELLDVETRLKKIKEQRKQEQLSTDNYVCEELSVSCPSFPYPSGPRDYQKEAFENWRINGQKALFAMATGTGKTITSLNCLLEIYKKRNYYKALILVPTTTLVNQWEKECRKFNFNRVIKVYSKNPYWREDIERISFNEKYLSDNEIGESFVIISTYASYSREYVFDALNVFDPRRLLLIADECHNMGSPSLLKRLRFIPYLRRIGLSATPDRQFDDEGNEQIKQFFGINNTYTFEYSMKKAIENGVLCKYMYYPHIVKLTTDEMKEYLVLSERISKYFNYDSNKFVNIDEKLKMLLLARKRIIHKAKNKLTVFEKIIRDRIKEKGNLNYTLVYVPEGNKPDYLDNYEKSDDLTTDVDAEHLIDIYTKVVTSIDERVTVRKFMSGQKDREIILNDFATGKLQVLTSMKCLDEGVDVPRSELAIFCASTGNPRQFIQRRGRVLRTHPDKQMAYLHDLVVAPEVNPESSSYKMEQSLLKGELARVNNFALLSENPSYSEIELREVLEHYALNLYNNDYIK